MSTPDDKKDIYLQHVNYFYNNIKNWLQNEPLVVVEKPPIKIYEEDLGTYYANTLSIKTADNKIVVDVKPIGACVVMAEGLIELESWLGKEYIVYMPTGGPTITEPSGIERPIYHGIDAEGWYWIEDSRRTKAYKMNKALLLELITMVTDHAF